MGGNFGDHVTSKASVANTIADRFADHCDGLYQFHQSLNSAGYRPLQEVGVRKVLGGNRWQLFWQMMGETAVIVGGSVGHRSPAGLPGTTLFKDFHQYRRNPGLFSTGNMLFLLGEVPFRYTARRLYPALVLSGFSPALALKNKITSANVGGISIRRGSGGYTIRHFTGADHRHYCGRIANEFCAQCRSGFQKRRGAGDDQPRRTAP